MTLDADEIGDGTVDRDEALGLALGIESLHLPLSSSYNKIKILSRVGLPVSS